MPQRGGSHRRNTCAMVPSQWVHQLWESRRDGSVHAFGLAENPIVAPKVLVREDVLRLGNGEQCAARVVSDQWWILAVCFWQFVAEKGWFKIVKNKLYWANFVIVIIVTTIVNYPTK